MLVDRYSRCLTSVNMITRIISINQVMWGRATSPVRPSGLGEFLAMALLYCLHVAC